MAVLPLLWLYLTLQELFEKPDLASAVDGWEAACQGVETQALARWRKAQREAAFWHALCRQPPPALLRSSVFPEVRAESLPFVFESFLSHLAEAEAEEWARAQSAAAYASSLERRVAEFCPSQERPEERPSTDVFPPYDNRLECTVTQAL